MESQQSYIDVTYTPGMTVYGSGPARLAWTDSSISLTKSEGTKDAPVYTEIFNVELSRVEKVAVMLDQVKFFIDGKRYAVSVAQYSTPAIGAGGVAGIAVGAGMYQKSGAPALIEWLRAKGVRVTHFGYGKLVVVATVAAITILGLIFLGVVLFG